jgi:hypothetical protein
MLAAVMIEAKCKERALLAFRDGLPIPEDPANGDDIPASQAPDE